MSLLRSAIHSTRLQPGRDAATARTAFIMAAPTPRRRVLSRTQSSLATSGHLGRRAAGRRDAPYLTGRQIGAYSATLDLPREVTLHLAALLRGERLARGTRRDRRSLGCFRQAVLALRWFPNGTRISQLTCGNAVSVPMAYRQAPRPS